MIDTWLFAALVLGVVTLCVFLRGIPVRSPDDRLVAGSVGVTLVSLAALTLSIATGMLIILDAAILVSVCCFVFMIWQANATGAGQS